MSSPLLIVKSWLDFLMPLPQVKGVSYFHFLEMDPNLFTLKNTVIKCFLFYQVQQPSPSKIRNLFVCHNLKGHCSNIFTIPFPLLHILATFIILHVHSHFQVLFSCFLLQKIDKCQQPTSYEQFYPTSPSLMQTKATFLVKYMTQLWASKSL